MVCFEFVAVKELLIYMHENVSRVLSSLPNQTDLVVLQVDLFKDHFFFGCELFIILLLLELQCLLEEHVSLLLETVRSYLLQFLLEVLTHRG